MREELGLEEGDEEDVWIPPEVFAEKPVEDVIEPFDTVGAARRRVVVALGGTSIRDEFPELEFGTFRTDAVAPGTAQESVVNQLALEGGRSIRDDFPEWDFVPQTITTVAVPSPEPTEMVPFAIPTPAVVGAPTNVNNNLVQAQAVAAVVAVGNPLVMAVSNLALDWVDARIDRPHIDYMSGNCIADCAIAQMGNPTVQKEVADAAAVDAAVAGGYRLSEFFEDLADAAPLFIVGGGVLAAAMAGHPAWPFGTGPMGGAMGQMQAGIGTVGAAGGGGSGFVTRSVDDMILDTTLVD